MTRRLQVASGFVAALVALLVFWNVQPDAQLPVALAGHVDPARQHLLDRLDLLTPGSVRFSHARCRADRAAVLFYAVRYLWVIPKSAYVLAPPPSFGLRSRYAGGILEHPSQDVEIEAFLSDPREVPCS